MTVEPNWTVSKRLDHGFVHLVDAMPHWDKASADGWGKLGVGDIRVVNAARVSMGHLPTIILEELGLDLPEDDRTPEQDEKLIRYLLNNKHTTPFEKVRFEFVAKVPLFVARQWLRHRMGSFNEMSARYTELPAEFYVPELDRMQAQSSSNKQASGEALDERTGSYCQGLIRGSSEHAYEIYQKLLRQGLARELARSVLPVNWYTQFYWTVDLHNLMGFLRLRLHSHAQYEIRTYAEAMLEMARHVAPFTLSLFEQALWTADG